MLRRFFFTFSSAPWPLLREPQLSFVKDGPEELRPSLDGQSGVSGQRAKEAPVFKKEPEGADWQHPAALSRGSMGKMVRSEKEFELLWLLGWWVHPAAAAPTKKDFPLSNPPWIYSGGKNCARNWMNRVEVAQEGERGSWRCHWCLREAVIGSTSYLLRAHTVITLTTQRIRLSVQTHPLPPGFFHVPPPLLWQMIQTARRWLALLCKHVTPAG